MFPDSVWDEFLAAFNIQSATLVHQSAMDIGRRVYCANGHVYKVVARQNETTRYLRTQDLAGEFSILRSCGGIPGVPSAIAHYETSEFEVLIVQWLPGEPLANLHISSFRHIVYLKLLAELLLKQAP